MGKRLLLLRHGQAEDAAALMDDHARPLSEKGRKECEMAARFIADHHLRLDCAIVSSAARTQSTFECLLQAGISCSSRQDEERLYLASAMEMLSIIHDLPTEYAAVMLVGHNPGLYELAAQLCRTDDNDMLAKGLPTCGLVILEYQVNEWTEIIEHQGALADYFTPHPPV